nr:Chain E, LEU-TYR-LYS-LYS-LEU-LYS-ARG-GLU-ILE-THR-PHE [Influenza A virus (A/chicken/China/028/2014(H7N9))]
LYKKLKREITF